jgi:hypothetical protein
MGKPPPAMAYEQNIDADPSLSTATYVVEPVWPLI